MRKYVVENARNAPGEEDEERGEDPGLNSIEQNKKCA